MLRKHLIKKLFNKKILLKILINFFIIKDKKLQVHHSSTSFDALSFMLL
jgi:hypothetical protein